MLKRMWTGIAACALAMLLSTPLCDPAAAANAGSVNYFLMAGSSFDQFTSNPTLAEQAWLRTHVWRMGVFAPYFNEKTSWYPDGFVYDDAYAIYPGSPVAAQHPEWILRDSHGNPLYIPFGCSGGTCPQYAGDIASLAFRRAWIENLSATVAQGYRGVFIDDVNMNMQVGNGAGQAVAPIDPSTGQPMTEEAWRAYMALFMQEVRQALPDTEIVHNVIWFADEMRGIANASIRVEMESANYINLERGANDAGLTGGTGPWSLSSLLSYTEEVHSLGRGVILYGTAEDDQGLELNLASYFLISTGNDAVGGGGQTPDNWWPGWSVELGAAAGQRYLWSGLLRRDFSGGLVLVNQPGEPSRSVKLASPMLNLSGNTVTSVTLPAASGAILRNIPQPPAEPPPVSEPPSVETPTKTVVEEAAPVATAPGASTPPVTGGGSPEPAPTTGSGTPPAGPSKPSKPPKGAGHQKSRRAAREARRRRERAARARRVATRIAGRVLRANRGRVTIEIQARQARGWVAVAHLAVAVTPKGAFVRTLALTSGRHYRLRADYAGGAGFRPSRSAYVLLVPHPPAATHGRSARLGKHPDRR